MLKTRFGKAILFVLVSALTAGIFSSVALAQKTTVTFWTSHSGQPDRDAIEKIAAEFNKTSKTVEVKVVVVPGAETEVSKLMTAVAGGTGPDVYLLDRFTVAQRAAAGALECLDPFIDAAKWQPEKEFLPFAWAETIYKDKCYALPWDTDTRALYYRTDLFQEVGLDPKKPPTNIEELETYAEKLTKAAGKGRYLRLGFIPWYSQGWHYTWGWAFGGEFYDAKNKKLTVNDPRIVESFAWQKAFADKYDIKAMDSFSSAFGQEAQDPFITGQLAMVISGDWSIASIAKFGPNTKYSIAPIPTKPGVGKVTWAGGWSLVIPKGAKHPKEAFEFMRFACGEPGQTIYARDTMHLPTFKSLLNASFLTKDPYHKIFVDLLPFAKSRPPLPVGALLWDELTAARDYAIRGQKTPKQALDDVIARVQPELDKYMK